MATGTPTATPGRHPTRGAPTGPAMTPVTVPVHVAEVALGGEPELLARLTGCGRQVGARAELDLDAVARTAGREVAVRLGRYAAACRRFWARLERGERGGPFVAVHRTLLDVAQADTKQSRRDLTVELTAADTVAGLGPVVTELTAAEPDWAALERQLAPFAGTLTRADATTVATLSFDPGPAWPAELGGPGAEGEVRREVTVTVNHAAWRDRRVRRLVRLTVIAEEIWPDPAE